MQILWRHVPIVFLWDYDYNKLDHNLTLNLLQRSAVQFFTIPHVPAYFLFLASLSAAGHKNDTNRNVRLKMYWWYVSALFHPEQLVTLHGWVMCAFQGGRHVGEKQWENTRLSADVTLYVTLSPLEPQCRVTRTFPPAGLLE